MALGAGCGRRRRRRANSPAEFAERLEAFVKTQMPGITDYIWPSNGGTIATRAKTSVFVVR